jgi:replicative DNA helicase
MIAKNFASEQAEAALLGSLVKVGEITENNADVLEQIKPELFFIHQHKMVATGVLNLIAKNSVFDFVTLSDHLEQNKLLDNQAYATCADLVDRALTTRNDKSYLDAIKSKYLMREMMSRINQAAETLYEAGDDTDKLNNAMKLLSDIPTDTSKNTQSNYKQMMSGTLAAMKETLKRGGGLSGLSTGNIHIDKNCSGLSAGNLAIIAGKPGSGKTTLAMNVMEHYLKENRNVLMFSLEMPTNEIGQKLMASVGNIPYADIRNGKASQEPEYQNSINKAINASANLIIDDEGDLHISQIVGRARKQKLIQGQIDLVVVDYIQIVNGANRSDARYQQVADVSSSLKKLAKELKCPVIALSQLTKNSLGRPSNNDLRESGQIEQDADIIIMLHTDSETGKPERGVITEQIFTKVRAGTVGICALDNQLNYQRFRPSTSSIQMKPNTKIDKNNLF